MNCKRKQFKLTLAVEYTPLPRERRAGFEAAFDRLAALLFADLEKEQAAAGLASAPLGPSVDGTGVHARQLEIV